MVGRISSINGGGEYSLSIKGKGVEFHSDFIYLNGKIIMHR